MDGYIKKSEAVDVIVKYPYDLAGKTATAIKMIEDLPSADVVPKSEVEKWYHEYHAIKDELKQEKMYHKETEKLVDKYCIKLEKANVEIETLKDNNEHLAVMLEETKIELDAMRGVANSYKMHYEKAMEVQKNVYRLASEIKAELPLANAELAKNVASEIFEEFKAEMQARIESNTLLAEYGEEKAEGRVDAYQYAITYLDELTKGKTLSVRQEDELYEKGYNDAIKDIEELVRGMK